MSACKGDKSDTVLAIYFTRRGISESLPAYKHQNRVITFGFNEGNWVRMQ